MQDDRSLMTLGQLLDRAARQFTDREAIIFESERVTYGQLKERVDQFARGLLHHGLGRGDFIALWMPNWTEWTIAFFAIAKIGATVVPCNTRYKAMEIEYVLAKSECKAIIMADRLESAHIEYCDLIRELVPELDSDAAIHSLSSSKLPALKKVIVLGETAPRGAHRFHDVVNSGSQVPNAVLQDIGAGIDLDHPAEMIFTGGTTGHPKGCLLSHKALCIATVRRSRLFDWRDSDRYLVSMPYFHIAGAVGPIAASCLMGSAQVVMETFDAGEAMHLIETEKVTVMSGVPTMFINIFAHPDFGKRNLGSLRIVTLGSTTIPEELLRKVIDPVNGLGVEALVMYGLTESGGCSHCTKVGDSVEARISTVGLPLPGIEARIVDPSTLREMPAGEVGEVWLRGDGFMSGYHKMPEATAEKFSEGWLRTSDMGLIGKDGYLRITGRLGDTMIVGGFNTYPVEIENYLLRHPKILEASVVGVPDAVLGEVPMAFVVPKPGESIDALEVIQFAKGRIANFKVPRFVSVVPQLPMTPTGKVQKFKLRELAAQNADKSGHP